jgi:hypothetical protein
MKIDFRKKEQRFRNINGLNDVYLWKEKDNYFGVGINGTSHHYKISKNNVVEKVNLLINLKN